MMYVAVGVVSFAFGYYSGCRVVGVMVGRAVEELWGTAHRKLLAARLKGER